MTDQEDDADDGMLKMTTLKKTLFFLALVSEPGGKGADLPPPMQKLAKNLCKELATEIDSCRNMRSILRQLLDSGQASEIMKILGGTPEEVKDAKRYIRQKNSSPPNR